MRLENQKLSKVLVIYTGGTIGMVKNHEGLYAPIPNAFTGKIRSLPEMHDEYLARKLYGSECPEDCFVLQDIGPTSTLISYAIKEYCPLLDSCNMSIDNWIVIAEDIKENYNKYDGFVVLHGTDTLAYTASALSFMLEGLGKTVVVTGSQIPIFEGRSDAKDNFISALIFASSYNIPEVCVFFANQLFRGNRTMKSSSNLLNAFSSPNFHCLGKVGIHYKIFKEYILKHDRNEEFKMTKSMNKNVAMLHMFPTITGSLLKRFIGTSPRLEGIVLLTYGIGNIPTENKDLMRVFEEAVNDGVIIVNISQCSQGTVSSTYETGKALEEMGIIPGHDMTYASALVKLSYVLGMQHLSLEEKKTLMKTNLRGELTLH